MTLHTYPGTKRIWGAKKILSLVNNYYVAWSLGGAVFLTLILGFFFHNALGKIIWEKTRQPEIALFFNKEPALAVTIGTYYFNGGAYDTSRAKKAYEKALARDPGIPNIHYALARIAFVERDAPRALEEIDVQIAKNGDSFPSAFYMKGLILGSAGQLDEAETAFKRFIALKKDTWAGYNDLAWIYFKKGDYPMTEKAAQEGLAQFPENPWLLTALGAALLNEKRYDEAEKTFLRAKENANTLTEKEWIRAYPGNNPASAPQKIQQMKDAIDFNLRLSRTR